MSVAKRIFLFIALNFLVMITISVVLRLLNVGPYLNSMGLNYISLAIWCLVWGMGGALISLALSRKMAKWAMGVQLIDPKTASPQEASLLQTVYALARTANLHTMPEVGIFHSKEPNAFATGPSRSRSLVAVSSGLLDRMSEGELKAVLAHEIAHVANGDMVTMTLLQGVINAFVMFLARVLAFVISGLGKNRNEESRGSYGSFYALTMVFEIVFMVLGSLIVCAYSRAREFRADAGGAKFAGKENMIQALQALQSSKVTPDPRTENGAIAAFKISRPSKRGLLHLFSTHPPLEERIARLRKTM